MNKDFDAVVLGGGAAGIAFARRFAALKKRVCLLDPALGGVSYANGCLPVKLHSDALTRRAGAEEACTESGNDAVHLENHDFLFQSVQQRINSLPQMLEAQLFDSGVEFICARGELIGYRQVTYKADKLDKTENILIAQQIVIATGSRPAGLPADGDRVHTHDGILALKTMPKSILIVGLDVEAAEFASVFSRYGVMVTMVGLEDRLLPGYDRDLTAPYVDVLKSNGVEMHPHSQVMSTRTVGQQAEAVLSDGRVFLTDYALITGARAANIPPFLPFARTESGSIRVDACYRTSEENIYAIGDVNGILGMGSAAVAQGVALADFLVLGKNPFAMGSLLPRTVHGSVEISGMGAQEKNGFRAVTVPLDATMRGISRRASGFVKIVLDGEQVVGLWFCAPNASDLASGMQLALGKGLTAQEIRQSMFAHPSIGEAILEAVLQL